MSKDQARKHLGAERVVRPSPLRPISDINVTALLGVVLVLVCAFLALVFTKPRRLDVQLPLSDPKAIAEYTAAMQRRIASGGPWCSQDYILRIRSDGEIDVNLQPILKDELPATLRAIFNEVRSPCKVLYVQPGADVRYGDVIKVVDAARGAKVDQVVMLSANEWNRVP